MLEIEVQGARQIRDAIPSALLVFIAPPSREALRERLVGRGTDAPEVVERRLRVAEEELARPATSSRTSSSTTASRTPSASWWTSCGPASAGR